MTDPTKGEKLIFQLDGFLTETGVVDTLPKVVVTALLSNLRGLWHALNRRNQVRWKERTLSGEVVSKD